MIIHNSALYIYMLFCGSFLITSSAENIDVLMVQEIARRKQWKEIVVVHCLETKFQDYSKWRNVLGPFVFMQWIINTHANEDLFNKHVSSGNLPIIVLPRCSPPLKVSRRGTLRKAFTWWFFHDREDLESFGTNVKVPLNVSEVPSLKALENQKISFESDVNVVILGDSKCLFSFIWAIYPAPNSTALQAKLQATWDLLTREWISQQNDQVLGYSRKELARSFNLNGTVLRVGVIEARADYEYDCHVTASDQENSATLIGGYSAHILNALQKILHFKVQIITSDTWGSLDHEGVWTGLIGLLTEDKIDVALCHPTITVERADAISFLLPTMKSDRVLVYQTSSLPITQDVFVRNFSKSLWLCLLLLLFLLAACLRLTTLVSASLSKEETSPWSWIEIALWTVAATCQQGSKQEPKGPSSSAVFLVGYLTLYLVYTAFAAGVTSQLAVQGRDKHLQLADTQRMHLPLVTHWGTLVQQFLQSSKDLAAQNILQTDFKKASNHLQELEHLMECVKCGHCVAISSRQVIQHHLASKVPQDEACQLTISRIDGSRHYKAIALQKNSPYVPIFNYWILQLLESGTISVEYSRSINHIPQCDVGPGYSSAGIGNVVSGVIILILGILLSLLLLGAERAWYWHVSEHNWQLHVHQEIRQKLKIV